MSQNRDQDLKIYEITNRDTGIRRFEAATNAEDACKQAGWLIGNCYVNEQKPRMKPVPDHNPLALVKILCQVCPYQYAECRKPASEECPVRPNTPELGEWLKQATQAHLCDYVGQNLAKKDYQLGQKWLTIEAAIKELALKP